MFPALALFLLLGPHVLTVGELQSVNRGEVLALSEPFVTPSGQTAGHGFGAIAVRATLEDTWKVLAKYTDKAEYQPRVLQCTVLSDDGTVLHVAMAIDAGLATARYTGIYTRNPADHSIHWVLDRAARGNTIQDMDGSYTLQEGGPGQTLVLFTSYVDSGHFLPHFIQDYFSVKAIPELLKSIKARVESGGTWHK